MLCVLHLIRSCEDGLSFAGNILQQGSREKRSESAARTLYFSLHGSREAWPYLHTVRSKVEHKDDIRRALQNEEAMSAGKQHISKNCDTGTLGLHVKAKIHTKGLHIMAIITSI